MNISIGVMAYNEEKNIGKLLNALLNQKLNQIKIKEIVVVSDGSTDKTDEIVRIFMKKSKIINLITGNERKGKALAINGFINIASSKVLVLESADTIPKKDCIEKLYLPLLNKNIGICSSHPIPINKKDSFMGFTVNLLWSLHHKISLKSPKFGELIAFKNIIKVIPNTAVDEEYISMMIQKKGFLVKYVPDAVVFNKGPTTLKDFLRQRRRIYCGHLELKKKSHYEVPTINNFNIFKNLISELDIKPKYLIWTFGAVMLEAYARLLGVVDFYSNKKHTIWKIAESTKKLE
ncbi:hypothetical protein COS79_04635 [Candidatus Woesearchaeota archaeon CG06_land_8_20_14_3_00_33_13]|nr:MAG: hypothetical protein COS79_04635 [Candidatus Woesearchaeota archaeon CG06_land_8_20_14_3_00_33_13]